MALPFCGPVASSLCQTTPYISINRARFTQKSPRCVAAERPGQKRMKDCMGSRRAHSWLVAASGNNSSSSSSSERSPTATESILGESDNTFFLKLLFVSFAGAAAVKYGSLLFDTPFQPSLPLGLSIIAAPCMAFAIWLGSKSL